MSLRSAINLVLEEYPVQSSQYDFAGNDLAHFIRHDFAEMVSGVLGSDERYLVEGSPGKGNWAKCPWVAVFDRLVTDTAQRGYYVVYLFRQDFEGVYLSLNQGVTNVQEMYGSEAKHALRVKASDYLAQLGPEANSLLHGQIDLKADNPSSLAAYYEAGSVCAKLYGLEEMPTDAELRADLNHFVRLYKLLVKGEDVRPSTAVVEPDEENYEDLRTLKLHKRVERNRQLAKRAKEIHGYECQVCGLNFENRYGEVGRGFIEAHHLMSLAELKGQKLKLDPKKDFAVLCSNCHRMIHKTELVSNVAAFREKHYLD